MKVAKITGGVQNCNLYYYSSAATITTTATGTAAALTSPSCIGCFAGYAPEQFNYASLAGGAFCKPLNIACNVPACKTYQQNTKYEKLQCQECTNPYSIYNYTLNSRSLQCDKNFAGSEVVPPMSVSYTGMDNSIFASYQPPQPTPTSGFSLRAFAVQTIVAALVAFAVLLI